MSTNPFTKAQGVGRNQSKSKKRSPSDLRRKESKSSLRSISDRPLKTTYEPPTYKSRAFRSRMRNENLTNKYPSTGNGQMFLTQNMGMEGQTQITMPSDMMLVT